MSTAENIRTMQAFLGYFNPAEATRMAQGGGARFGGKGETSGAERRISSPAHMLMGTPTTTTVAIEAMPD